MTDIADIKGLIEQQGAAWKNWSETREREFRDLKTEFDQFMAKSQRPGAVYSPKSDDGVDRKLLTEGLHVLLAGNQTKAMELFVQSKAMSAGSDPDGGYLVNTDFSSGMTSVMAEISPVYRLARVIPIAGDAFEEPIDVDGAEALWVGELETRADTDTPQLGMFRVELNEIYAQPKTSQKLIDTARIDVINWLRDKVSESFAEKEGLAFHTGDGVGKPRGFLTYPTAATKDGARPWGTLQFIKTGVNADFPTASTSVNPADVLVDVVAALKPQYRRGAVWLMNRATAAVVRKLKDADGRHVWVDSLIQGQPSVLLGYPVEIDEAMPDIDTGSLSIAFGNITRAYTIVEKPGVKFLVDPYTNKPNVKLFSYRRVGGGLNHSEAIKLLKFAN